MSAATLKAYAQLVRLPNLFTAIADVWMGWFVAQATAGQSIPIPTLLLLMLSSACSYCGGMVLNDVFDVEEDRRDRPFRPIPSGRVSFAAAQRLGFGLWIAGYALFTLAVGFGPNHWVGALLFVAIFAYDRWAKKTPLGPTVMGLCRFCNVLVGGAAITVLPSPASLMAALLIGGHVACLTFLAKRETVAGEGGRFAIVQAMWTTALLVPASALAWGLAETPKPWTLMFIGVVAVIALISYLLNEARRNPAPVNIQNVVKQGLLAIILLDASLAAGFVGLEGFWLLILYPPAALLGRFAYST